MCKTRSSRPLPLHVDRSAGIDEARHPRENVLCPPGQRRRIILCTLASRRLDLVLMGADLIEALLADDLASAKLIGGFRIPEDLALSKHTLQRRLDQMHAHPEVLPWLLRAVVFRESMTMCGRIGFHSAPGAADLRDVAPDGVEIGYAIGESFRGRGYAKEAALTLMRWAHETCRQRRFVLSIAPHNAASLALARSLGFNEIGSHIDEEDGPELYFARLLDRWPDEWGWVP